MTTSIALAATLVVPITLGLCLWTAINPVGRADADPDRDAFVGRLVGTGAKLLAVTVALSSGRHLAESMHWRVPQVQALVAVLAVLLIDTYLPVARRILLRKPHVGSRWRYLYHVWAGVSVTLPVFAVAFGSCTAGSGSRRALFVIAAVGLDLALTLIIRPFLSALLLTEACPEAIAAMVLDATSRSAGPSVARTYRIVGGQSAFANAIGFIRHFRFIAVSSSLLESLPLAEIRAIVMHEVGHVTSFALRRYVRTYSVFVTVVYGYLAFGRSAILVATGWAVREIVPRRAVLSAEYAADAFAAGACGAPALRAALLHMHEINGRRLDNGGRDFPGGSHPSLSARLERLEVGGGQAFGPQPDGGDEACSRNDSEPSASRTQDL